MMIKVKCCENNELIMTSCKEENKTCDSDT